MTLSNGNISELLALCEGNWGESIGHWWNPLTKASDAELWCVFIYDWTSVSANNRDAVDLGHHRAHYDATVMTPRRDLTSMLSQESYSLSIFSTVEKVATRVDLYMAAFVHSSTCTMPLIECVITAKWLKCEYRAKVYTL